MYHILISKFRDISYIYAIIGPIINKLFNMRHMAAHISWYHALAAIGLLAVSSCSVLSGDDEEFPEAELYLSAENIEFDESDPDRNTFIVTSNTSWRAESDTPELKFEPESGKEGDTEVRITGMGENQTGTITVTTQRRHPDDKVKTGSVTVHRGEQQDQEPDEEDPDNPDIQETLIYYDDLDKASYGNAVYLDQWDGYINATGPGSANVSYSGQGISIRDTYVSVGYEGASGSNAMNFGYDDRSLTISGLTLDNGQTTLEFTFGITPPSGNTVNPGTDVRLYVGFDGIAGTANELELTVTKGTGTWNLCSSVFRIEGGTPSEMNFVIWSRAKSTKIDDFRLTETGKTPEQTVEYTVMDMNVPWPELPETVMENPDYKYVTHWAETVRSRKRVRNYSACYDTGRHNPVWVAYPMHSCYQEGGYGRTSPDPWRPDPEFSQSEQSVIYGSDWADWPWNGEDSATDLYQYWSPLDNGPFFGRGHILRSADRGGHNTLLNIQTFYPTNIAPERFLYPDIHQELENKLSDEWTCSDTTYVVAGCHYEDDRYYVYDACSYDNLSSISKECDLPAAQFKIYLRTRNGNTGKRICDCSAAELQAIGFWLPQDLANEGERSEGNLRDFAYSVSEIEEKLGNIFNFFPGIPEEVKDECNPSEWGIR